MEIDWHLSIGNLLTIGAILFSAVGFYYKQVYDSRTFKEDIVEIKIDLKALNKVMTDVALQNQRLDNQGDHINRLYKQLDELRHGHGWVANGEYPRS